MSVPTSGSFKRARARRKVRNQNIPPEKPWSLDDSVLELIRQSSKSTESAELLRSLLDSAADKVHNEMSSGVNAGLAYLCGYLMKVDPTYASQLARARQLEYNNQDLVAAHEACAAVYRNLARTDSLYNEGLSKVLHSLASRFLDLCRQEEALAVLRELVTFYRDLPVTAGDNKEDWTTSCPEDVARRLSHLGHHEEALMLLRERVAARRDLAKNNYDFDSLYSFASALDALHSHLTEHGRQEEALSVLQERVAACCSLARDNPRTRYTYAKALEALSCHFFGGSRQQEALAVLRERVTVCRDLAKDISLTDHHLVFGLFGVLSQHSYALGCQDEALPALREHAATCRTLAMSSDYGRFGLASALELLFNHLSQLDRQEEAVTVLREYIAASGVPSAWVSQAVQSLCQCSHDLGRSAGTILQERVAIYRGLAGNDRSFDSELSEALESLSSYLLDLGRKDDVAGLRELVVAYNDLAEKGLLHLLADHEKDLDHAFQSLLALLSGLRHHPDVSVVLRQRIAIYHQLAQNNGPAYGKQLAAAFQSLFTHLSDYHQDVLVALEERVAIYGGLARRNPLAYGEALSDALQSLLSHLSNLGRRDNALAVLQAHMELYLDLAKNDMGPSERVESIFQTLLRQLSILDQPNKILELLRDRVAIYRGQRKARYGYPCDIIEALDMLRVRLLEVRRPQDALAIAEESVAIYRDVAKDERLYYPKLSDALKILCSHLSNVGLKEDALAAAEEVALLSLRSPNQADSEFNLVAVDLLSTSPCPTSYPNLQRYMLTLSLSLAAMNLGRSVGVTCGGLRDLLLRHRHRGAIIEDANCVPLPVGLSSLFLTLHDEAAHRAPQNKCTPRCYQISLEMVPGLYGHGNNLADQLHLLCHLQHHILKESQRFPLPSIQTYFMVFHRFGDRHVCLSPSVHPPHDPPTILLDLLQICLTDCNKEFGYLWTRQPQKTLLLRMLQDVCSVTGKLPELYRVRERPRVNLHDPLGSGAQSSVYQVIPSNHDTRLLAVRIAHSGGERWTSPKGQEVIKMLRREIIAHWQLRHANVLPLAGVYLEKEESAPWMMVPLAKYGSAASYLQEFGGTAQFCSVIHGAALGLEYLHTQQPPVIHGDVHDANILVDTNSRALLCDFGLSRIRHEVTRSNTTIQGGGKPAFTAPELSERAEPRPNEASDIYAFAMTILKLGTGSDPFDMKGMNAHGVISAAQRGVRPSKPSTLGGLPDLLSESLWSFMEKMWAHDPKARPTASEVVAVTQQLVDATSPQKHKDIPSNPDEPALVQQGATWTGRLLRLAVRVIMAIFPSAYFGAII